MVMVAYERADNAERVVFKQHFSGFGGFSIEEEADHLGDIRPDRAAFLPAQRFLALQAAPGFIDNVNGHVCYLLNILRYIIFV